MPFLELFDETLDINSTENYELSVQVSPDGLAFCLLDTLRNKFVMLRTFEPDEGKYYTTGNINDLILKDDFMTKRYKKVRVVVPSRKFTLVPAQLFDPVSKDEYFAFNHIRDENTTIEAEKLGDPDAFLVFPSASEINDLVEKHFPGVHPCHHIQPLLIHISRARKIVHGNYIHIHIERDYFNLIIYNHNTLRFCNTFSYTGTSDILYFVLNAFKNLDIMQEETIHMSGLSENYDDLSSRFSLYVRNIKFSGPSGNFTFSYIFNETELHRYINLFTLTNCE
jgi:hypothetical protein